MAFPRTRLLFLLSALSLGSSGLSVSRCAADYEKANAIPEPNAAAYCYETLGQIDCFNEPQSSGTGRLVSQQVPKPVIVQEKPASVVMNTPPSPDRPADPPGAPVVKTQKPPAASAKVNPVPESAPIYVPPATQPRPLVLPSGNQPIDLRPADPSAPPGYL